MCRVKILRFIYQEIRNIFSAKIGFLKMVTGRALHFVFKIPDRKLTIKFYREILGMKVRILI